MLAAVLSSRLEYRIIISCIDYDLLVVVIVWSYASFEPYASCEPHASSQVCPAAYVWMYA